MTECEPPSREANPRPSQSQVESLSSTLMRDGEINNPPEIILTSHEEPGSGSSPDCLGLSQVVIEKVSPEEPPPPVLYKVQYMNKDLDVVLSKENEKPMEVQNTLSTLGKSVIEVITDVLISEFLTRGKPKREEPRTAFTVLGTKLKINSPAILTAIRSVIEYYPDQSFSKASDTIMEPYAALIHHEEELKSYRDRFNPNAVNSKDELCHRTANAYEHLGILQNVLFERSGVAVEAERQRHARGVATFQMLWLLFRPGTDVYSDDGGDGEYNAHVIKSVSGGMFGGRITPWKFDMWSMDFDGNTIGRRFDHHCQPMYDGEKDITSLRVFPCHFWKEKTKNGEETKPLRRMLEERGKMFFKLTQRQCMNYNGTTYTWPKNRVSISGNVVMVFREFLAYFDARLKD